MWYIAVYMEAMVIRVVEFSSGGGRLRNLKFSTYPKEIGEF